MPEPGALHVLLAGTGEPLLYLHGTGDAGRMLPVLETLAGSHRVIRPDHPGFLESDELGVTSVAGLAEAHRRLLDELGVGEFTLVGCSLGGWVAAELALLVPDRIRELVLIDPAGLPGDGSAPDLFALEPGEALDLTVHDEARRAAARATAPDPVVSARLDRSREAARRLASHPYMHDPSLAERAAAGLRMPVQLVWGENDGIVPLAYARDWTAALPQARLHVIAAAGHLPQVERPEEFLAATGLAEPAAALAEPASVGAAGTTTRGSTPWN